MTQTVTIGIPTFNRADRFLRPAIECALNQSWQDLEIIVSDNCSTDNTREVVRSYDDPRLRYVRQEENIGANNNFNFCVNAASGSYFLLFHDDDAIDQDMIASCMAAVGKDANIGLIRTGTRLIDGDGQVIREIPNRAKGLGYTEFFRAWMKDSVTSYVCSTLFNTRMLQDIGGFQSTHGLYQDLIVVARLMARGGHADVEEVKASFRRHAENYGNSANLVAWCEDGRELADVIAAETESDNEILRREALRYLCKLLYRKAHRVLPDLGERVRAYRMIQREFNHVYPFRHFFFEKTIGKWVRRVRRFVRRSIRGSGPTPSPEPK